MNSLKTNSSPKENFRINYFIYLAILAAIVGFQVTAIFIVVSGKMIRNTELENILMFIVPTLAVGMIFLSRFIYAKITQQSYMPISLHLKIGKYRMAKILSWAMLEGAGLFSIISYILTASYLFTVVFVVILIAYFLSKPSTDEFVNDFIIEGNERNELYK